MGNNILQKLRKYPLTLAHMLNILHKKENKYNIKSNAYTQKTKKKVIYMRKTTY